MASTPMRTSLAEITILSLLALALCCQGVSAFDFHAGMEHMPTSMPHLVLLAASDPVPLVSALVLLLVLIGLSIPLRDNTPHLIFALPSLAWNVDIASPPPLQVAFSDGILNTKRF